MAKLKVEVPSVGESVKEGVLAAWLVRDGERVSEGADLFELETDKASMAVPSPASGVLHITVKEGSEVAIGQLVAEIDTSAAPAPAQAARSTETAERTAAPSAAPAAVSGAAAGAAVTELSPAVRRLVDENRIDPSSIPGTGKGGRLTKGDVLAAIEARGSEARGSEARGTEAPTEAARAGEVPGRAQVARQDAPADRNALRRREPMSTLRKSAAKRLVEAQSTTAHLTTFNEVNMERIMALRSSWQESFQARHGVKLGIMSFFISAACQALAELPVLNAMIDGDDVVYSDVCDIGVAVSTDRGLVVPVIRDAGRKSLAELERALADLAERARAKKLLPDELRGGTFSITNGGVFGSLLSTPIINYPQSAILGLHTIQKRPVVADDQIVAKPMMYVALSYDHRLIDGREAVTFLARIKALCESPERLLLGV